MRPSLHAILKFIAVLRSPTFATFSKSVSRRVSLSPHSLFFYSSMASLATATRMAAVAVRSAAWRTTATVRAASTSSSSGNQKGGDGPVTHTGQEWDPEDIRMTRYMHTSKETNPRWAVNLVEDVAPKLVDKRVVQCDGGGGALGHPRVYINLDTHDPVSCIYCGLRFQLREHNH